MSMSLKILVTGARGMLGSDVVTRLGAQNYDVEGLGAAEFDITNPESAARIATGSFDWVVNCAAYTRVDDAETDPDPAYAVNAVGPGLLARGCGMSKSRLIHISTDYVFNGKKVSPYIEDDDTYPLSVYGQSKLAGEEGVFAALPNAIVLRSSWLFGSKGHCFPRAIMSAARAGKRLRVVNDQTGTPTWTEDLAQTIANIIAADLPGGVYHAAGNEVLTWFEFARRIPGLQNTRVEPIGTEEWPTPAPRPKYSALNSDKLRETGTLVQSKLEVGLSDLNL